MFRWVEVGLENNQTRYETLSQHLKQLNFANEVQFLQIKADQVQEEVTRLMVEYDGIRIGRGLGELVLPLFHQHPLNVSKIKAADAIVKLDGVYWLKNNAAEAFLTVLKRFGEQIDFLSSALVVGAGAAARVAVSALVTMGFKKVNISSHDSVKVNELIRDLNRTYFGIEFNNVNREGLILLPGTHGVLVNTTPMSKDNPMLDELYYFNFLKSGGLTVDFSISPVDTPLLLGAKDVGANCIYGYQVAALTDIAWAEQVSGLKINSKEYENILSEKLRALQT